MTDGDAGETGNLLPRRPGERLRDARQSQGLSLEDIATRTRIPQRHLAAIEAGDYGSLPSETYAMGFSKAYARAVGVDEVALSREVRGEIAGNWNRPAPHVPYEISDPARTPSRGLVLIGIAVALLLAIGAALWFGTDLLRGGSGGGQPATAETTGAPVATVAVPPPGTATPGAADPRGEVVLTASDTVWVRVYDTDGKTLFQDEMTAGERYAVPADAKEPRITVARADRLAVTINGSAVPPLGDGRATLRGAPIDAASLLSRGAAAATPAAAPSPAASASSPPAVVRAPAPRPAARSTPQAATPAATEPPPAFRDPAPAPPADPGNAR